MHSSSTPSTSPIIRRTNIDTIALKTEIENLILPFLSRLALMESYLHFLLSTDVPQNVSIFRIFELYLLCMDSTASTTTWALAFLVSSQTAQEKHHNELTQYLPQHSDRESGRRQQAALWVVKETMRMKPVAPLAVPHKSLKETMLDGKRVAAGTAVLVNLYAILYNPKLWPEQERFLCGGGSGSSDYMLQSYLQFGGGMRACSGGGQSCDGVHVVAGGGGEDAKLGRGHDLRALDEEAIGSHDRSSCMIFCLH